MTSDLQHVYGLDKTAAASELAHLLGSYGQFKDYDYASTSAVKPLLTGIPIEAQWVKNSTSGTLLPGEIVTWKTTAVGEAVGAKADALDTGAGVVSHALPAAGVADGLHFWLVRKGPTEVIQSGTAAWDAGDALICGASGRVDEFDPTDDDADEDASRFGVAMEDCVITAATKCRALVEFKN